MPGAPSPPLSPCINTGNPVFAAFKPSRIISWSPEEGNSLSELWIRQASLARKVGAEFIGTLILMFAGIAAAIVNQKSQGSLTQLGVAATTGLAAMVVILSTGHISGAHVNPGVTIAFAALNHLPWRQVPVYVGAQIVASICASFALKVIFDPFMGGGVTVPAGNCLQAFALEFIISFNLMFVVTAVATDSRAVGELAGIAVGATVTINILISGESSGASMNPVRSLGPAIATNNYTAIWVYLTAPILGALCGAGAYSAVKLPDQGESEERPRSFRRS
ncbi:hypothetical protein H6P81_000791 [Aristolochia fimbriata]|uniref:Uncharacterized protein n=1 Tax=Aristolochia fimbriata TaxID=158543 RepID=A0AAV7F5N6_ARIFI|nr:hypothetical protein H6P81_000791 [Aristolochia fimbriata]